MYLLLRYDLNCGTRQPEYHVLLRSEQYALRLLLLLHGQSQFRCFVIGILLIPVGILLMLIFILWTSTDEFLRLLEEKNEL